MAAATLAPALSDASMIPLQSQHEEKEVGRSLAAPAQPLRLQAFRALVVVGTECLTPGTMAAALQVPAATLSFHPRS